MKKNKDGFTIIEVVLVLAIAGLIFLMVFVALPALQRSQRDTQRRDDVARLATAVTNFQANGSSLNNTLSEISGQTSTSAGCTRGIVNIADIDTKINNYGEVANRGYALGCKLIRGLNSSDATVNTFADPDGTQYKVYVYKPYDGTTNSVINLDRGYADFGTYAMVLIPKTRCSTDAATGFVASDNPESFTVRYRLEGGGIECVDNGYDT